MVMLSAQRAGTRGGGTEVKPVALLAGSGLEGACQNPVPQVESARTALNPTSPPPDAAVSLPSSASSKSRGPPPLPVLQPTWPPLPLQATAAPSSHRVSSCQHHQWPRFPSPRHISQSSSYSIFQHHEDLLA